MQHSTSNRTKQFKLLSMYKHIKMAINNKK